MANSQDIAWGRRRDAGRLPAGERVTIHGLKSQDSKWMNGQVREVERFDGSSGRYIVTQLGDVAKAIQGPWAIKPINLVKPATPDTVVFHGNSG